MMDGAHQERGERREGFAVCMEGTESLHSCFIITQKIHWDFAYIRKTYYEL